MIKIVNNSVMDQFDSQECEKKFPFVVLNLWVKKLNHVYETKKDVTLKHCNSLFYMTTTYYTYRIFQ